MCNNALNEIPCYLKLFLTREFMELLQRDFEHSPCYLYIIKQVSDIGNILYMTQLPGMFKRHCKDFIFEQSLITSSSKLSKPTTIRLFATLLECHFTSQYSRVTKR